VFIIFIFNYYLAITKELNFIRRFFEMICISLGVAALSFGVGFILKNALGVE
jgi:VIT1/CCC1 family predicted Fe2+/Mn2+ transporter